MTGTIRDPLTTNNERVKLLANSMNAVGLGLIGFAILRPLAGRHHEREPLDALVGPRWPRLSWRVALHSTHDPQGAQGMTFYEFLVPIVLFVAFWVVYLILRVQVRKLDRGE